MTRFRKQLMIVLAAVSLGAGSVSAFAAPGPEGSDAGSQAAREKRMQERMAKRQTELHDSLKLTPAQEPAWNLFLSRIKPAQPPGPRPDRAEWDKLSAPERMERMLARMQQHEKVLSDRIVATKQFYGVLTPEQQKTFNEKFGRGMRGHGPEGRRGHHGHHGHHGPDGKDGSQPG